MNFAMTLRIALKALGRNKMRSGLTMLGIIIGVGAVIAMIAIGSGAKARIQEQIASMGSNLLIVLSGSATSGGFRHGSGSVPTLTVEDAKAIASELSEEYGVPFLYDDFRIGWAEGVAESKQRGMYRQKYCGCVFSELERYKTTG